MSAVLAVVLMVLKIIGMICWHCFCFCCWRCCCLRAFTSVGAISAACVYSCVTARCTLPCTRAKRMKRKKGRTEGRNKAGEHAQKRADFRRTAQANPAACKSGTARTAYNGKADGTHGSKARKSAGRTPKSRTGPAR